MKLRATLLELWSRVIDYNVWQKVYRNGENDQYSLEIEGVIDNSPTGSRVKGLMSRFVAGAGLKVDYNLPYGDKLSEKVVDIADDYCAMGGAWIHRTIKIEPNEQGGFDLVTDNIEILDYHKCRKGKVDDNDNQPKILYGKFSGKSGWKLDKEKTRWFYPFSNKKEVISAQIFADAKAEGLETENIAEALPYYRGQVYYMNSTPKYIYAKSPFDAVYNDLDSEYRLSLYTNKEFRDGFMGKMLVFFSNLDGEDERAFRKNIKGWLGAENSSSIYVGKVNDVEQVKDSIYIKQVDSQFEDDLAVNTEKRIRRNILGAGDNAPESLIFSSEDGLFSSGEGRLKELKAFYNEQTYQRRLFVEKALRELGFETEIIPIVDVEE